MNLIEIGHHCSPGTLPQARRTSSGRAPRTCMPHMHATLPHCLKICFGATAVNTLTPIDVKESKPEFTEPRSTFLLSCIPAHAAFPAQLHACGSCMHAAGASRCVRLCVCCGRAYEARAEQAATSSAQAPPPQAGPSTGGTYMCTAACMHATAPSGGPQPSEHALQVPCMVCMRMQAIL